MRRAFAFLVLLAGCAQISGLASLDVDASTDATVADAANDALVDVVIADAPQDAGADANVIPCALPGDCPSGDVCCAALAMTGSLPQCRIADASTACKTSSSCATSISQTCTKATARTCATSQDCTESFYNKCCVFPYADASIRLCSTNLVADAAAGYCP